MASGVAGSRSARLGLAVLLALGATACGMDPRADAPGGTRADLVPLINFVAGDARLPRARDILRAEGVGFSVTGSLRTYTILVRRDDAYRANVSLSRDEGIAPMFEGRDPIPLELVPTIGDLERAADERMRATRQR